MCSRTLGLDFPMQTGYARGEEGKTMSSEYGNDFITLTGDNGEEVELEHLDTLELDGEVYAAFVDANLGESEEAELYILKFEEEDGEEVLATVDDEAQLEKIYNLFLERFAAPDQLES